MADIPKKKTSIDGVIPSHWLNDFGDDSKPASKLSPKERVAMIEKVYMEVLLREPDTRDLNFYKYSTADEESIRAELLESKEHKTLDENGREFKKVKNLLDDASSKIKSLESELKNSEESVKQMEILLKEKNLHIDELRRKSKSPFEEN